ncbi:MAG: hypothetical protein ACI906_002687 [Candidatus Latescibacterota bacterium]
MGKFIAYFEILCAVVLWGGSATGADSAELTYYLDSREYNTANVLTSVGNLPWGMNLWGFTDFHGEQKKAGQRFDLTRYFMEYRLRKSVDPHWVGGVQGMGVEFEYNDANGRGNQLLRFGLNYKRNVSLWSGVSGWLQGRVLPYETDGSGQQLSLIHFLSLGSRLTLAGFSDWNLNNSASDRWVAESQASYRMSSVLSVVLEVRYNGYEQAHVALDGLGIAVGISAKH